MSSQSSPETQLLRTAYMAFNACNADAALALLTPKVAIPMAFEGGFAHGHEEIRAYWTKLWNEVSVYDEPVAFRVEENGQIFVEIHQVVRDMAGAVLTDQHVGHRFTIEHNLIQSMEICPLPSSGLGA